MEVSAGSIFIDESGEFGDNSKYYLVTLVLHDQSEPIDGALERLDTELGYLDFPTDCAIHTGPIVRREDMYVNMSVPERKRIFTKLFAFARRSGAKYKTFAYKKSEFGNQGEMEGRLKLKARLARDLSLFIDGHQDYFTAFDKIIAYYDGGQALLTDIINTVFAAKFFDVDFRRVLPSEYRLFQAADLFCTLELMAIKDKASELTASDLGFFGSAGRLRKDYLKQLEKMRFEG